MAWGVDGEDRLALLAAGGGAGRHVGRQFVEVDDVGAERRPGCVMKRERGLHAEPLRAQRAPSLSLGQPELSHDEADPLIRDDAI